MKKYFFILFLFLFSLPVNALDPVIIQRSNKAYPPGFGEDQNYVPSNPGEVDTTTYTKTFDISQTYDPNCSVTDQASGACTTYTHQTIDNVTEKVGPQYYTNWGINGVYVNLANYLKNLLATPEERMTAFKNYDLNGPLGTGNFTNRGLSYRDWLCTLSRKIDQVYLFMKDGNATCIDEEIGKSGIRFSQVILAVNKNEDIYYKNCESSTVVTGLPNDIVAKFKEFSPGELPENGKQLFQNGVTPICSSSIASRMVQCDLDSAGGEKCKDPQNISIPRGAAATVIGGSNKTVKSFMYPAAHEPQSLDFGKTVENTPIADQPNQPWWQAVYKKVDHFWNDILGESKTFAGPTKIQYSLDNRVKTALQGIQDADTYLIPKKDGDRAGLYTVYPSSDKKNANFDPGNSANTANQMLYKSLTPCSWQPGCQM